MHVRTHAALAGLIAATLLTAGCGVGQGVGTSPSDDLLGDIAIATSGYLVLDLGTGSLSTTTSLPDVATNPAYRDSLMVFRAIDEGAALQGSSVGDFGHQADEARSAPVIPRYYIGIFEVTQAQWQRLAATTPWTAITPASLSAAGATRPAHGIARSAAVTALAAASGRLKHTLALPSEAQWERACRGGATGTFAWGEARDEATAGLFAQVAETAAGAAGPAVVGARSPNAIGLYDMHGNVWELTASGTLRGGSWHDTLTQARCANRITGLDQDAAHALVGLRLVLTP